MTRIAILGANGRLANVCARAFHAAGHDIMAVTRSGCGVDLPPGIEQRAADAMDRDSLIRATEGADLIFNGLNPLYPAWRRQVMPMGENVMAAARAHGATHLFPGNVYNYGRAIPAHVTENTPFEGSTGKGAIRIALERRFEEEAQRHGVRTIIVRAGDFFGGARPGSWFDLIIAAKIDRGQFTYPGPMDVVHSWAYLPDLAATFVALAERRDELAVFESFLFEGHALTGSEMLDHCVSAFGRPLKVSGVPWPLLRLGGLVVPMWREVCEMAYLWQVPHRLDGRKLDIVMERVPRTDPKIAVARALADMSVAVPTFGAKPIENAA